MPGNTLVFHFLRVVCEGAQGLSVASISLRSRAPADGGTPSCDDLHISDYETGKGCPALGEEWSTQGAMGAEGTEGTSSCRAQPRGAPPSNGPRPCQRVGVGKGSKGVLGTGNGMNWVADHASKTGHNNISCPTCACNIAPIERGGGLCKRHHGRELEAGSTVSFMEPSAK